MKYAAASRRCIKRLCDEHALRFVRKEPSPQPYMRIVRARASDARVLAIVTCFGYSFVMCNGDDCRFPARMRLKKQSDYESAFRRGRLLRGKYFQFRVLVTSQEPRIGISVSRRYGNAVSRNRVKRMIREVFRCHKASFYGVDLIVQPRSRCRGLKMARFEEILLDEYEQGMGTEVKDGKRSDLPDEERARPDARGAE
ncbi:MAG TPA: ribonuclease P protein component [Candidatus Acetothermia bacterium]|nr:ribonuclease P protein component [Candidatus Acetothermia bacterium]HEX32649.1 ribonuclease P protein component [Candidatus Acetothermia bacterium]